MNENPRAYQRFFAELKRRGVFRASALYGGIASIVVQGADLMGLVLHLEGAVVPVIVVVVLFGFPITLVLTWTYDVNVDGLSMALPAKRGELEGIVGQPRHRRWPSGFLALAGALILLISVWWALG